MTVGQKSGDIVHIHPGASRKKGELTKLPFFYSLMGTVKFFPYRGNGYSAG